MASLEMNVNVLLEKIRGEANRLCAGDPALPRLEAYERAVVIVFMTAAEEQATTPFEEKLLSVMKTLHDANPTALAFRSSAIGAELDFLGMSVDSWTLWSTLSSLERRCLVHRPKGPKSWALLEAAKRLEPSAVSLASAR